MSDNPDSEPEPLEPIREHEEAVEKFAEERDDALAALARCLQQAARGESPDPEECEEGGLPIQ